MIDRILDWLFETNTPESHEELRRQAVVEVFHSHTKHYRLILKLYDDIKQANEEDPRLSSLAPYLAHIRLKLDLLLQTARASDFHALPEDRYRTEAHNYARRA